MFNKHPIFFVAIAFFIAAATPLPARTWTDVDSGRRIEGDYVKSDATHVVVNPLTDPDSQFNAGLATYGRRQQRAERRRQCGPQLKAPLSGRWQQPASR